MTTIRIKLPKIEQVEFEIKCLPEDIQVKGNCSAIDEETDTTTEQMIYDQLNNGNQWAWCTVKVTANWKGLEGSDYLGCCSYESEEDFKSGGYFQDMKEQAFNDLISKITSLK